LGFHRAAPTQPELFIALASDFGTVNANEQRRPTLVVIGLEIELGSSFDQQLLLFQRAHHDDRIGILDAAQHLLADLQCRRPIGGPDLDFRQAYGGGAEPCQHGRERRIGHGNG
jgi:hypothetical protein